MRSKAPAVLLLLALVTACSGGKSTAKPSPTPSPTPSATPSAAPRPTVAALDWLTGTAPRSTGALVGIKVDNAFLARPYQTGLGKAAIVYQELVEGGLTRLLAVYESDGATAEVGPIRSVRESDVELLRAFPKITVGFSGAQGGVLRIVHAAQSAGWLYDASYDVAPQAYRLGARRADARNFFARPSRLAALRNRGGGGPVDIGLRFGALALGGLPTTVGFAHYAPQSGVTVRYNPATHSWSVAQNGRLMGGVGPANIIIQRVVERGSGFFDVHGMPTPYTVTIGNGAAVILRDGKRYVGRWQRSGHGATHFVNAAGHDIALRPGRTWVLLVPTRGSVSFR